MQKYSEFESISLPRSLVTQAEYHTCEHALPDEYGRHLLGCCYRSKHLPASCMTGQGGESDPVATRGQYGAGTLGIKPSKTPKTHTVMTTRALNNTSDE